MGNRKPIESLWQSSYGYVMTGDIKPIRLQGKRIKTSANGNSARTNQERPARMRPLDHA
jgi:hypothetical protein